MRKLRKDKTLGYLYFMDKTHPLADAKGRVWAHRAKMMELIGRPLLPTEVVHHRNGRRADNRARNLALLSSGGAHTAEHNRKRRRSPVARVCSLCREQFSKNGNKRFCSARCYRSAQRRFDPSREELSALVWTFPVTAIARGYGVSDSAVIKRCRLLGVRKPAAGFWS